MENLLPTQNKFKYPNILNKSIFNMTVTEFRLILLMLSKLPQAKEAEFDPLTPIYITKADMVEIGCEPKNVARDLRSACENLRSRQVIIPTGVGDLHTSWLYNVLYFKSEIFQTLKEKYPTSRDDEEFIDQLKRHNLLDTLPLIMQSNENMMARIVFHPDVLPYLIQLKNKFTQLELQELAKISSSFYSFRIFLLMLEWKDMGAVYKRLDDLRKEFGLENKYDNAKDLKRRVIDTAVAEINEKTDWQVGYTLKKTGRKFTHIELKFKQKTVKSSKNKASEDMWLNFKMSDKQLDMFGDKIAHIMGYDAATIKKHLQDVTKQADYIDYLKQLEFKPSDWFTDGEIKMMQKPKKVRKNVEKTAEEPPACLQAEKAYRTLMDSDDSVVEKFVTDNQKFLTTMSEKHYFAEGDFRKALQSLYYKFNDTKIFNTLDFSALAR